MPFRVSHQALFDRTTSQIMQGYDRYTSQQALVASGKAFLKASDAPIEAVQSLQGRQMININEQYQKNLQLANGWITYTDQNLDTVIKGLQDARQKVVQVSNDVTFAPGSPQREATAKAINAILEEMLGYSNAQYEGRYIYAGYKTQTKPFDATRNAAGEITAVTYNGNNSQVENIKREVSVNTRFTINVDGKDVWIDPTGTDSEEKVFNELIKLRDDLRTNNPIAPTDGSVPPYTYPNLTYISQHLTALQNLIDRVDLKRGEIGETSATMQRMFQQTQYQKTNLQDILSSHEDLDMAKGALQLTNQLNLYQAAINAGGKIVSPTLMQFLR